MHPSEEESRLVSGEGPVNLRTALKQQRSLNASARPPHLAPTALQQRIERVHTRNRFGASLVEHLSSTRVSAQPPASGAQIAGGVLAACGCVVALLGAIQSLVLPLAAGIALTGCGALGWKLAHRRARQAGHASALGAQGAGMFDPAALAAFDAALEAAAPELDEESAARLLLIKEAFKRMGHQVAAYDEHFTVEDRLYLRECLRRYVPDSVAAYLRVPVGQRSEALLPGQPCAQVALCQQLDGLLEEIRLREQKIGRSAAEQLVRQQRFLASKKSR